MHGRTHQWPAWVLAIAVAWGACALANAQGYGPPMLQADPAYDVGINGAQTMPGLQTPFLDAYPTSNSHVVFGEASLAERVADLEAELKKMKDKEAAAKEQAAGKPSVKVGGRIQMDWATFDQNPASINQAGDFQNGTEFRRARMFLSGDAFEVIDYKIQMDFADQTDFKDVYLTVKELPLLGHVRVGHFKVPFSLEQLTSTKSITFMERALPADDQGLEGRRTGVMVFDHSDSENFTWAIGAFAHPLPENPPIFQNDSNGTAVAMRYTYLPWYDEASDGRGVLHTGVAYAYGAIPDGTAVRLRQRPEANLAERVVDTGDLWDVESMQLLGVEAAFVYGPFSAQAEYFGFFADRNLNPDTYFSGAYGYVSYFLTGENRRYKRTEGIFDRVKPFENFFRVRDEDGNVYTGKGAWELAYRYSYLDLNDAGVIGGRVGNHTCGLNWYLNPYTRIMWNYVHSETNGHPVAGGTGTANIFEMRCQIDF